MNPKGLKKVALIKHKIKKKKGRKKEKEPI